MNKYKIGFVGLWHLGCVYSNYIAYATKSNIVAFDKDKSTIDNLNKSISPVFEPGLDSLTASNLLKKRIIFTNQIKNLDDCDIVWITLDTKLGDDSDQGKYELVLDDIFEYVPFFKKNVVIIISSQIPITAYDQIINKLIELSRQDIKIVIHPENLRLGSSISYLKNPDRLVFGIREEQKKLISSIFPNNYPLQFVCPKTALLTKHVINSFLATSVAFANEVGSIAKEFGINTSDLTKCVRSDFRIGSKAYLQPGEAFGGGTLGRDVNYLCQIADENNLKLSLIKNIFLSNEQHKLWPLAIIKTNPNFPILNVLLLGATYKEGTNTLRKSNSFYLYKILLDMNVNCFLIDELCKDNPCISLKDLKKIQSPDWNYIIVTKKNEEFSQFLESLDDAKRISLIDQKGDYINLSKRFLEYNSLNSL